MAVTAIIVPGAVTAGDAIDLPAGMPEIGEIVSATIVTVDFGGTTLSTASATATKESATSFSLDTNVTATDIVILVYVPVTEYVEP